MMMQSAVSTAPTALSGHPTTTIPSDDKLDPVTDIGLVVDTTSNSTSSATMMDEKKENPSSEDAASAATSMAVAVATAAGGGYVMYPHASPPHYLAGQKEQQQSQHQQHQHPQPYPVYPPGSGMMMTPLPPHFMNSMSHHQQQIYVGMALQQHQQRQAAAAAAAGTTAVAASGGGASPSHHPQLHSANLMLESQFQSLSLDATSTSKQGSGSGGGNNDKSASHGDGGGGGGGGGGDQHKEEDGGGKGGEDKGGDGQDDDEEEPVKLFVGQVPKTMNEEDIFPTFDSFGPLKDVAIIRDKHTQLHRGCAFVTYWSASDAEKAQTELHGKHTFPGARRPAQVKPAEPSVRESKLFIGMLSKEANEDDIREMFEAFGEIKEIFLIRNHDGTSKCAAFLRYEEKNSAEEAIKVMHSSVTMEGSTRPLIVKYADNKQQRHQRHMRNVRRHEMMGGLAPGAYPYPPHMAMHPPGPGGHPQYAMPGAHPQYGAPFPGPGGPHGPHAYHPHMYAPHQYGNPHQGPYGAFQHQPPGNRPSSGDATSASGDDGADGSSSQSRNPNPRPREGPAGANLFVYHLPHDLTDADLATAFNPFGNVISAKVYVDRFTGDSKGFGFVSYDSVIAAESAIEQMNGFQIGNKRLKVQHKRVHGNQGGGGGGGGGQNHYNMQAHGQHMMPHGTAPAQIVFDPSVQYPHGMHPSGGAAPNANVPPEAS